MKTCENCYWFGKCFLEGKRCEDYDPVMRSDSIALREYRESLQERKEEYQKIIHEQNN